MIAICDAAIQELTTQFQRINSVAAAQRTWDRVLTADEREMLGDDFYTAYRDLKGSIGIWVELHGGSGERAVTEIAYRLGFIDLPSRDWLLRELGEAVGVGNEISDLPVWDPERRQLRFRGVVIRKVPMLKKGCNVVPVLGAFQSAKWPPRIDDPLPGKSNNQRIHKTIESLNRKLTAIRFSGDGTGRGISWNTL